MSLSKVLDGDEGLRLSKRPNLTREARKRIERYVLMHGLKPGDRLPTETELCEMLGVSRPVVRSAIHTLEEMGMVSVQVGRGTFLNTFDPACVFASIPLSLVFGTENLSEISEVRHYLERLCIARAIRMAADRPDHPSLRQMVSCADRMAKRATSNESMLEDDIRFHQALASLANNRILLLILKIFWELRRFFPVDDSPAAQELRATRHRELIKAIMRGDEAAAIRANEHLFLNERKETHTDVDTRQFRQGGTAK